MEFAVMIEGQDGLDGLGALAQTVLPQVAKQ